MNVDGRLARLEALLALTKADPPPPPSGNEIAGGVAFDFTTPSVLTLGGIPAGSRFSVAIVLVTTPFNAPATLQLGVSASPAALFDTNDSRLQTTDQYQSDALVVVAGADVLQLRLSAAGATAGAGYLYYRYLV